MHVFINGEKAGMILHFMENKTHRKHFSIPGFSNGNYLLLAGVPVYGSLENPKVTFTGNVKLRIGSNKISLLSIAVGLPVSSNFVRYIYWSICISGSYS